MTTFGPQLIGQTEKTLQTLLVGVLDGTGLDERLWVTLWPADQPDSRPLRGRVADLARFADADALVTELEQQGLVADGTPTFEGPRDAGRRPRAVGRAHRAHLGRYRGRRRGRSTR